MGLNASKMMDIKKLRKSQRGFTLVELLIAVALTTLITAALTGAIFQVFTLHARTTNRMTAVRQVQQAGFWVCPDIMSAQNVTPGANNGFPLTLNWTIDGASYAVVYSLEGSGSLRALQRKYYVNSTLTSTTLVAEYILHTDTRIAPTTSCSYSSCPVYNLTVTAKVGDETETRVYQAQPRPGT